MNNTHYQKPNILLYSIIGFLVFILIIVFVSLIIPKDTPAEETGGIPIESNLYSKISNPEVLDNIDLDPDFYSSIMKQLRVLSVIYSDSSSFIIEPDSVFYISPNDLDFTLTSDKKTFSVSAKNDFIEIYENNFEIYKSKIIEEPHTLSPHLIDKYFPYKNTISDNTDFEAKLQENKKDIKIMIPSCVSKDMEKEAIEKTKKYISNLNSDPSFFDYSTVTFCF